MDCVTERRVLKAAQVGRDWSLLREAAALDKAFNEIKSFSSVIYDWGFVRKAQANVRRWEARCELAEVMLTECLEKLKF